MEIRSERLILRPWKETDATSLFEYAKDPAVGPVAGWPIHSSVDHSLEIIKNVLSAKDTFAVCLKEDNRAIGSIGLFPPTPVSHAVNGELEIGYWVGVPFWGRGYIPEAIRAILPYAFYDLGCSALWCGYFDGNEKSKRCQEKCGFNYHHTEENKVCHLIGEVRTEHYSYLSKGDWEQFSGMQDGSRQAKANIIQFPQYQVLKEEIEKLQVEISLLLLERDELHYVICKNIETAYLLALGALEFKAYDLHCKMLRLKRKIELIQAKINRQEQVSLKEVEEKLDAEFAEYQAKLNEQIDKMNEALERKNSPVLTEEENKELKHLYRSVVKHLHPDLHPEISEAEIKLFHNAVFAYENGDLQTLQIINEMVADKTMPQPSDNGLAALVHEKERLQGMVLNIQKQIEEIKETYPYNLKPIVQSQDAIDQKKAEIKGTIAIIQEMVDTYQNRIDELLR